MEEDMERTWGDDIFAGFSKDPEVIRRNRIEDVKRDVGYILGNYKITKTELVSILKCGTCAKVDFNK